MGAQRGYEGQFQVSQLVSGNAELVLIPNPCYRIGRLLPLALQVLTIRLIIGVAEA